MSPVTITKEQIAAKSPRPRTSNRRSNTTPNYPDAWEGGVWRPRDIAEIEMIASRASACRWRRNFARDICEISTISAKRI